MRRLDEIRLNNHQQHMEDLVLFGKEGLDELNDKIDKFIRRFDNSEKELNLTQKVDGAPALFCWSKFNGYPDNSIALKGFTSGPNTALSSDEQIDAKYGDRPDMAAKLKLGLRLAKYIPEGEAWQGDCLFSHDDIKEEEIEGKNYLTFQPNKIVYAFSEDNADYNKVANSDFGICFHTIYKDAGDGNKSQSFDVDPSRINAPDNFYIMSPAINASKDKNDYDLSALDNEYNKLKQLEQKLISDPHYEELVNNSTFMNYWNTFENANLADKKQVNINVSTFINELKDYIKDKQTKEYNKKLNTLKTDQGKQKATDKYNADVQALQDIVENNKSTLINLVNVLNSTANIKMMMWAGLKKAKNDYSTFYKSRTKGYFPAEGEGIAMSDMNGNIVKIVDRSSFSSYNRDPDIMSGFEHESLNIQEGIFGKKNKFDYDEISSDDAYELIELFANDPKILNKDRYLKIKKNNYRWFIRADDRFTEYDKESGKYEPTVYYLDGYKHGAWKIQISFTDSYRGYNEIKSLYNKLLNMDKLNDLIKSKGDFEVNGKYESVQEAKRLRGNLSEEDAKRLINEYQKETSRKVPDRFFGLRYYLNPIDEFSYYDNLKYDEYMPTNYNLQGWDIRNKRVVDLDIYKPFVPKSFEIAEELYWKQLGMSKVNKILKNADLSNIDFDDLNEDFKLNSNLQKALGDKADQFIEFIKKLNMEHKAYDSDVHPLGMYVEARDKGTHQENVHNFWLKNFGLDTAKRGIGSAIASALSDMNYELESSDEYKDTLDYDDSDKLPKDEKFKINLFYEWDAAKKNFFGDYSDDDPIRKMSFREFLEYKLRSGDYEDDHEKQLIKDAIKDVKGGSGYFKEMVATQGADMGSFNTFTKKLTLDEDGARKVAVVGAGRLNPPTIGHEKLINAMVSYAQGSKPMLFLTHSQDNKKNPLSYQSKIKWARKAFGDRVNIPETNAKTILQFLQELYQDGYTDIIYVGGGDRIGGAEDVTQTILKYNGQPDKQGNIIYNFNSIDFKNAGERSGNDLASNASASLARKYVLENDFDHFKEIVPFNENNAYGLFKELKYAMTGKEESFLEACNKRIKQLNEKAIALTKSKYTPEVRSELNKELKNIDNNLEAPNPNMGQNEFKADKDDYTGLFVKQGTKSDVVYSPKDIGKLYQNEAPEVVKGLEDISIEDNKGNELKLSPTGATVLGEDKFNNTETTYYQEAIYSLLLGKRINKPNLREWLLESDPVKGSGIFKYVTANVTNESLFKNQWINFVKDWGKAFETIQENSDAFVAKANSILDGDATSAVILHPGIKSKYQDIASVLLSGADKFDKSDSYFCVGNVNKLTSEMAKLKEKALGGDISDYVNFMQDHSDEIIGVSLKKPGSSLHIDWDIPAKDSSFFDDTISWIKTDALSQKILLKGSDGETYIMNIRPNSQKLGSRGTIEWQEKGAKAAMGKAFTGLKRVLGDEFTDTIGDLMSNKEYVKATAMLLNPLVKGSPVQGSEMKLSNKGKELITKIFNISCGFGATDDSGKRVTAPYIKCY